MAGRTVTAAIIVMALCQVSHAGEWMFRLKDAHVQLRQALFDRHPDAAWEHVDRATRQQAGILAARIRSQFDALAKDKKQALRKALGIDDDVTIRTIQGKNLLVARFFIDAHSYMLVGDRDDTKLKDHGTRMAGPTGIIVHKKTPHAKLVPYRFTAEGHFGGQAMDYRAQLNVPTLDAILGDGPVLETLSPQETARRAVDVFRQVQHSLAVKDFHKFWSLLDCDSQSLASHFADQAQDRASKKHLAEILQKLSLRQEELDALDGVNVWALQWSREELAYIAKATNPKYVLADQYDKKLIRPPLGYKRRDKPSPEPMIEFQSEGRTWQIPARVNYRSGSAQIKLFIRPPFYLRLRK